MGHATEYNEGGATFDELDDSLVGPLNYSMKMTDESMN